MKKHLGSLASFYLGGSLGWFGGIHLIQWEFWAITLPVIILFTLDKNLNKNE